MIRHDLSGKRMKTPDNNTVYLIDGGQRRAVTKVAYDSLFKDTKDVIRDSFVLTVDEGATMVRAHLVRFSAAGPTLYLLENQKLRPISKEVLNHYAFDEHKTVVIPLISPDELCPIGDAFELPHA
jgi:hypothetical protein